MFFQMYRLNTPCLNLDFESNKSIVVDPIKVSDLFKSCIWMPINAVLLKSLIFKSKTILSFSRKLKLLPIVVNDWSGF